MLVAIRNITVLRVPAVAADPGDQIRKLVIVSAAQASDPQEFQAAQLLAQAWRQLGLDIEVKGMPRPQLSDLVWNTRDKWDMTMWRMVGRPERSDPDEFAYNLFNPATAATGYDFVGYDNPNYMKIAEAQRSELDQGKRKQLIYEAQDAINKDQPYIFLVYPKNVLAYDKSVWKQSTVVEQSGIGIRSFWTYLRAEPLTAQKDMITNAAEAMLALNPLYISGAIDSWLTEIIWDRLMRVGPDGLPIPWAAEKVIQVDPNTVDCVLRPGQQWHDGKPMTVDDVVFSFKAPATGDKSPMYKPFVANIADVMATDRKTVRFKLKTPSAAFAASTLAKINLIPKHVWEPIMADLMTKPQNVETYQEQHPIGSGPFKVARFKFTEEIVLEANKDYWETPKPERVIMRIITNTSAALGMLPKGEINFLTDYRGDPKLLTDLAKQNPGGLEQLSCAGEFDDLAGAEILEQARHRRPQGRHVRGEEAAGGCGLCAGRRQAALPWGRKGNAGIELMTRDMTRSTIQHHPSHAKRGRMGRAKARLREGPDGLGCRKLTPPGPTLRADPPSPVARSGDGSETIRAAGFSLPFAAEGVVRVRGRRMRKSAISTLIRPSLCGRHFLSTLAHQFQG